MITNYSELKTAVANWLDRDDLTNRVEEFIQLAETDLYAKLRVLEMETIDTTLTTSARRISVPSDFIAAKRFNLDTDPLCKMYFRSVEGILEVYSSTTGQPEYFTIIGGQFEFNKVPDDAYTTTLVYYAKPDALSTTATNSVLTNYPNLFLYGALKQAAPYLGNDERLAVWHKMYAESLTLANDDNDYARYSGGSLATTVNGAIA